MEVDKITEDTSDFCDVNKKPSGFLNTNGGEMCDGVVNHEGFPNKNFVLGPQVRGHEGSLAEHVQYVG